MTSTQKGAVRLFRVFGIDVFLHWSWVVVAVYQIGQTQDRYTAIGWNIAEYLALFLLVLLHEFGHALACRQVGGKADRIMLWPLGGVAYIAPPPRPGALLWSIVAGPLVNLVLLFPLVGTYLFLKRSGWDVPPDALKLVKMVGVIDIGLLIFNLIPVYPLDGGQIVRALLWFPFGPARSLSITTAVGFVGAVALAGYAFVEHSFWTGAIAVFIFMRCLAGWKTAKMMKQIAASTARPGFSCPSCHATPPVGLFWRCAKCRTLFDAFESSSQCPACHEIYPGIQCQKCYQTLPMFTWQVPAPPLPDPTESASTSELPASSEAPPRTS